MTERVDVVIVGAGLSGIGAACHLRRAFPGKSFVILEAREALGGTWDLFRYPGIRSDSDMFTLGYAFEPWKGEKAIADGPSIRDYIAHTARKYDVERRVRFGERVTRAAWSSEDARWTLETARAGGETRRLECAFVWMCTGYYRYDAGFTPELPGRERYEGTVVHPQHWPEGLDVAGKRVVVIGSGATAMTLVPALAERGARVTMLQRSPTYVVSRPARDAVANALRKLLPEGLAYDLSRWKNVLVGMGFYELARRKPELVKRRLLELVEAQLGSAAEVAKHFTPRYAPWDQRVCLVPDDDLFHALKAGRAEVVTDTIETFTARGLALRSGPHLDADLVVTATGLELCFLGDIALEVDGRATDPATLLGYKGFMLSGVPNLACTFGYTNASWTLKADLIAEHVCRLLAHLDRTGMAAATPRRDEDVKETPWVDLTAGYIQRAASRFPRQGDRTPWKLHQNYLRDLLGLRLGRVDDPALELTRPGERVRAQAVRPGATTFASAHAAPVGQA